MNDSPLYSIENPADKVVDRLQTIQHKFNYRKRLQNKKGGSRNIFHFTV